MNAGVLFAFALRVITLADAENMAAREQPKLRQAKFDLALSRARVMQARASLLPQISAGAAYQRDTANYPNVPGSMPPPPGLPPEDYSNSNYAPPTTDSYDYFSFGLYGSQALLDLPSLWRHSSSRALLNAQGEIARGVELQIQEQVATAWFAARARQQLVAVARDTLANRERHLREVEAFVSSGTRPEIDLAQARVDAATAEVLRVQAENDERLAKAQLLLAIGAEQDLDFEVAGETLGPVDGETDDPAAPATTNSVRAVADRFDIAASNHRIEAQRLLLRGQRAGYAPTVSLSGSLTEAASELTQLTWNFSVGLSLNWMLFDGLRTQGQVREAEATLGSFMAIRDGAVQQARFDVVQARLLVRAGLATVIAGDVVLRSARDRLRLAEGRYAARVGSALELADAQLGLTTAAAQRVQAEWTLSTARAQLLFALGRRIQ